MATEYVWLYLTAETEGEALALGRALVAERLVACVNVLGGATSVFRWEGEVQEAAEVVLVAKTRASLVAAVVARVRELHSYSCPCVLALPILGGNPDFLHWIGDETRGS